MPHRTPTPRRFRLAAALALILALPAAAGAELVDRVVAVVNNEAITLTDLNRRWLATKDLDGAPPTRDALLTRMIEVALERQRAAELGLTATAKEVDDTVFGIMADNGIPSDAALEEVLARDGRTLAEFHEEISTQITLFRLVQREVAARVRLSDADLRAYYDAHQQAFARAARVHLRQIFVPHPADDTDAALAMAALRAKVPDRAAFLEAEKGLAGQPGVKVGPLGTFAQGELMPELEAAVFGLPEGAVSDPVPLGAGTALFLVDKVEGGAPPAFEDVADQVREQATAAETERRMAGWLAALKANAYINIRDLGPDPA